MQQRCIDLNCDLGESDDPAQIAVDAALLRLVSSVSIACGGHAGDEVSMRRTVSAAMECGVRVGAHPSFPDRANFGRTDMRMTAGELRECVGVQIRTLARIAGEEGMRLSHVKPHGALYHAAMTRREVAQAVADAVREVDCTLLLVGQEAAPGLEWWRAAGADIAAEAFADRRYESDGTLRARQRDGALITDPAIAADQALALATGMHMAVIGGRSVALRPRTICVHSDTPGAVQVAGAVRRRLEESGIRIRPMAEEGQAAGGHTGTKKGG